jgi:hypothetical protein
MIKILTIPLILIALLSNANAQLQTDVSDSVWTVVMPMPSSQDVDMKQCVYGSSGRDTLVEKFVKNDGTWPFRVDSVYFRGTDASAFSLVSGFPKYIVENGKSHGTEFHFNPTRVGIHSAEIVIITQTDTLIQNIRGEGLKAQLQLLTDIIDFGQVSVGSFKDTVQVVTIKNIGNARLYITNTKHNKPNDVDFTTLNGGSAFSLDIGDTCRMNLRFRPGDVGRTSGLLEFYYDGVGSPAAIQLFGEGISGKPKISVAYNSIPDIICENHSDTDLLISNRGGSKLEISEINLKGTNPNDFYVNEILPIVLRPDSSVKIKVSFIPNSPGTKSSDFILISNAGIDSILSIPLIARKDSVALIPDVQIIDLGYLCPNESKDSSIIVRNDGTIASSAYINTSANISTDDNILNREPPSSNHCINFKFSGLDNEGYFSETISIIDSLCGFKREVKIYGEVAKPVITSNDLVITALVGTNKTEKISISNNSKRDYSISIVQGSNKQFQFTGNTFPLFVPVAGIADLPIQYTPDDMVSDTFKLNFYADPCSVIKSINILGVPTVAWASIATSSINGYPGDTVVTKLLLTDQENIQLTAIKSYKLDLMFNPTLLLPLGYDVFNLNETTSKIILDGLSANISKGGILKEISFIVGLGNSESCDLKLSNVESIGGIADIRLTDGKFILLGTCKEGGNRLINPLGKVQFLSIKPNPAKDEFVLKFEIIEKTGYRLLIINSMGQTVHEISKSSSSKGIIDEIIDISNLPSGVYNTLLQTETETITNSFIIIK